MEIKTDRTFTFTQENILEILASYLKTNHQIDVKPEDLKVDIVDSDNGDWHGPYVPAFIRGIWVKVPA